MHASHISHLSSHLVTYVAVAADAIVADGWAVARSFARSADCSFMSFTQA